jgi:hypothetical protein
VEGVVSEKGKMDLKRSSDEGVEEVKKLKQTLGFVQEGLVDLLEVLNLGDVFTAKAVAVQMVERIRDIPKLKERQKAQVPENVQEFLEFQPVVLKSLAPILHRLLRAMRSSDFQAAQAIARQLEGLIKEEPFLDFTEG